ncbi:MAG: hypothetical protein DRI71_02945 [Bacteroidetes bacterium]|nr:MAG: hypothetical protein DRI71_02945 [Bacteroidota bacterium]
MVSLTALWLPILLSAVLVFVLSSIIHMVFSYHESDFKGLPQEKEVMDALRSFNLEEGEYVMPKASGQAERNSDEYKEKMNRGPMGFLTIYPSGPPAMGKNLVLWFIYALVVSVFAAYIAGIALKPDAHYLSVFRFTGTTAFVGYSLGLIQNSIWYKRAWSATFKSMFDGLIYALFTAGVFGWLWP